MADNNNNNSTNQEDVNQEQSILFYATLSDTFSARIEELEIEHVVLTSDENWDPTALDSSIGDTFNDAVDDYGEIPDQSPFDETGNYKHRDDYEANLHDENDPDSDDESDYDDLPPLVERYKKGDVESDDEDDECPPPLFRPNPNDDTYCEGINAETIQDFLQGLKSWKWNGMP